MINRLGRASAPYVLVDGAPVICVSIGDPRYASMHVSAKPAEGVVLAVIERQAKPQNAINTCA